MPAEPPAGPRPARAPAMATDPAAPAAPAEAPSTPCEELPRSAVSRAERDPSWLQHWDIHFGWPVPALRAAPPRTGLPTITHIVIVGVPPETVQRLELLDGLAAPFVVDGRWTGYRRDTSAGEIVAAMARMSGLRAPVPLTLHMELIGLALRWGGFTLNLGLQVPDPTSLAGLRALACTG